jgi:hypothetical protein
MTRGALRPARMEESELPAKFVAGLREFRFPAFQIIRPSVGRSGYRLWNPRARLVRGICPQGQQQFFFQINS